MLSVGSDSLEINLSEYGKTYFVCKDKAIERDRAEREERKKLESDLLRIQEMSVEELREIYSQALQAEPILE
jgi:hypothetical protein